MFEYSALSWTMHTTLFWLAYRWLPVHSRRSVEVYVGIHMRAPSLQTLDVEASVDKHGSALDLLIPGLSEW